MFNRYERLRERCWGGHLWSRGYCVSTFSIDEDKIRKYVQWQEAQDKREEVQQKRLFD